jgi:hypothetical protein
VISLPTVKSMGAASRSWLSPKASAAAPELKQMARGWPLGNTIGDAMGLFADKEVRVSVLGQIQRGGSALAL